MHFASSAVTASSGSQSRCMQGKEAWRRRVTSQKQGVPLLGAGGDGGGLLPVPFTRNRYCT